MKIVSLRVRQADDESVDYGNDRLIFSLETQVGPARGDTRERRAHRILCARS
jgi:hypothetical protein